MARQVIVDLLVGDLTQQEVSNLREQLGVQREILAAEDSLVQILVQKQHLASLELQEAQKQLELSTALQEDLHRRVVQNRRYAIGLGCSTAVLLAVLIRCL